MRITFLFLLAAAWMISGCNKPQETVAPSSDSTSSTTESVNSSAELDPRQVHLKDNIEFHLRANLGGQSILIGPIADSEFDGFDRGTFTLGRETYQFLTTEDDDKIIFLAMEPFETFSADERAAVLAEEAEAEKKQSEQREADLASHVEKAPVRGNPDAQITVVEFSDFECPYCKRGFDTMEQLIEKRGDEIRFVYLHFPLSFHPWAKPSAVAAVCAAEQNDEAFWTLHDYYFNNQNDIEVDNVVAKGKLALSGSAVNIAAWEVCSSDKESAGYKSAVALVDAQADLAQRSGVSGTPGFFINGTFLNGAQPLEAFEKAIDDAKSRL